MLEVTVRCRIDEETKEKVGLVLDQMGMSLSTAIRLFLKRMADDGTFPFEINRSKHDDSSGIKAALIHMINSGQVSAQGFAGLLGDDLKLSASNSSTSGGLGASGSEMKKELPNVAPNNTKKVRKQ
jgi:addiction module RelB/DinJ family antitoxin